MTRVDVGPVSLAVAEWPGRAKGPAPARPAPKGPAVVCIHGLTANHLCWASVADVLSPAHRLIAYDLRGRGDSDKPDKGYSLASHGEDLEALLDHFKLKKAILVGHSLGANIALRFAAARPQRVERLVLIDGGLDVRHEVLESLRPAINRLGVEFPSLDMFLGFVRMLPMFEGRWNDYLERYFRYDVEELPGGTVRAKASRLAIEEEIANLERERLWVHHHRVKAPTLIFRAPDGLLTPTDCLMTQEEAEAMARAIPRSKLVVVPGTNHYTVLLGQHPKLKAALRAFLKGA
jgi:pimeloyl-ACP methyl ester carboxylesterase